MPGGQPQGQYIPTGQYVPQGQPQTQYVPQGQPQYQFIPQGQPQYQYVPQGYQPQGQYSNQGFHPPQGQTYVQGTGNVPFNYQSYPQPSYITQYSQPVMGQNPGMNIVWDPSQTQQVLQPNVQLSSQTGQPLVSGSPQQPVQSNIQTSVPSVVSESGPTAPRTPSQTTDAAAATSVQSTPLLVALIVFTIRAPHKLSTREGLFIPKVIAHWICSISKAAQCCSKSKSHTSV